MLSRPAALPIFFSRSKQYSFDNFNGTIYRSSNGIFIQYEPFENEPVIDFARALADFYYQKHNKSTDRIPLHKYATILSEVVVNGENITYDGAYEALSRLSAASVGGAAVDEDAVAKITSGGIEI